MPNYPGPSIFKAQCSSKSAKTLGLLKRTLYPAKPKVKEAAYNMLVRPKLEYGAVAWNPHTQNNNIDTLEKIHRSAARFVVHDHRHTTSVTHVYKVNLAGRH